MSSLWTGQKSPWLSSELRREAIERAYHLGASSQAVKPTDFETLIAFVQQFQA